LNSIICVPNPTKSCADRAFFVR